MFYETERRLDALDYYGAMIADVDGQFEEIVRRAASACTRPIAAVTFLDARRQWFKAKVGFSFSETPIEHSFCAHVIRQPAAMIVVPDATKDDRFCRYPFVESGLLRFYAGAPIITPEGVAIGTIFVGDEECGSLSDLERELLHGFAREAMAQLEANRWRTAFNDEQTQFASLQTSEAYFRHLTEHALDLITILDVDGTIRFESRSIEGELGYPPEYYRGRNAFDFIHPDDREGVMSAFLRALATNDNTPVLRFRFQHRDGGYRILEGTGKNLLNDPLVRGIVFNSRDVTERVRLQDEVERERLQKEESMARLTGGVAHDFNNILTAIQGMAELAAARVPKGSSEAGFLDEIQTASRRAAALTQQLLAFSRRVVLQPRSIELQSWLSSLDARLRSNLGPGVPIRIDVEPGLSVWQDPAQLEQVLLQLAANAREAMPHGGCFCIKGTRVSLDEDMRPPHEDAEAETYVHLTVSDEGCGMDEALLGRIFDPFFTTRPEKHPGMGLSMCRGIVEQSGGHLRVESCPGQGTAFHLYLPARDAVEEPTPTAPPAVSTPSGVPTILFVDDEPMLREIGETILMEGGYRVIVAEDGQDALVRLAELGSEPLDLLVSDVVMPGMTGVELAAEIGRLRPGARILLCSGYTRDALAASGGLPAGIAFLPKPYTLATLLGKVEELLAAPQPAS